MHPVLRNPKWLTEYVAVWLGLGYMLAALLRVPGGALSWREALGVAVPLCLFFAFVCLTPWYMCRQLPPVSTNGLKIAVSHSSAAVLATALWVALARAIGYAFDFGSRLDPAITPLIPMSFLSRARSTR